MTELAQAAAGFRAGAALFAGAGWVVVAALRSRAKDKEGARFAALLGTLFLAMSLV